MVAHGSMGLDDLLTSVVAQCGLVLEGVQVTPAGRRRVVRVVVDLPAEQTGSVDLDQVAEASRAVSQALDEADALGGAPYVLEVTSPGVDRPLTEARHWARARGRLVSVAAGEESLTGRVVAVEDDEVVLEVDGDQRRVALAALGPGRVQVEFTRRATGDDEVGAADGADEVGGADGDDEAGDDPRQGTEVG